MQFKIQQHENGAVAVTIKTKNDFPDRDLTLT